MVKGVSRQVIVVHSPDRKMFEQAIFILKEGAVGEGVTDELLLRQARQVIKGSAGPDGQRPVLVKLIWAAAGAAVTGLIWLVCSLL